MTSVGEKISTPVKSSAEGPAQANSSTRTKLSAVAAADSVGLVERAVIAKPGGETYPGYIEVKPKGEGFDDIATREAQEACGCVRERGGGSPSPAGQAGGLRREGKAPLGVRQEGRASQRPHRLEFGRGSGAAGCGKAKVYEEAPSRKRGVEAQARIVEGRGNALLGDNQGGTREGGALEW